MSLPTIIRLVLRPELKVYASSLNRLPVEQIDVLIVGEMGQDHSATGLDPGVIGRRYVETQPEPDLPAITRLVVLNLSDASLGDACGIGFADLTTRRLVGRIDPALTRERALASGFLERVRVPITLPTDRDVFRAAMETCWRVDPSAARLVIIPDTRHLRSLWISPALEAECGSLPDWELAGEPRAMPFDDEGTCDLSELFPDVFSL